MYKQTKKQTNENKQTNKNKPTTNTLTSKQTKKREYGQTKKQKHKQTLKVKPKIRKLFPKNVGTKTNNKQTSK